MNYRHAYHAGSFADVVKHASLVLAIERLKHKPAPFAVIDTHAGTGRYDLGGEEAQSTQEHAQGIGRLLAAPRVPAALCPYVEIVRRANRGAMASHWYPGSPKIARALLRPTDRLELYELHPEDARLLARAFAGDRQVAVHAADGWAALRAALPPAERRGLVLIDPAFEKPDEFDRLLRGLRAAHRRWANGVYVLWYPIKDPAQVATFTRSLAASGIRRILSVEFMMRPPEAAGRLAGCGLVIVNPPWQLDAELAALLPDVLALLGAASTGRCDVRTLVAE